MNHADPFGHDGRDLTLPSPARVYDHLLGGKDNYEADRALAERMLAVQPRLAHAARENRAFVERAVRRLAEAGHDQFVDIGCGLPTLDNVHQIAARRRPGARVLYLDNDPIVLAHGRALLTEGGDVGVAGADLREPRRILDVMDASRLLDLSRPVVVLMTAVLHFLTDADGPYEAVAEIRRALPAGSALVISHLASDVAAQATAEAARLFGDECPVPLVPRPRDEVAAFFGELTPVSPGLVFTGQWCPSVVGRSPERTLMYAGIGASVPLPELPSRPRVETVRHPYGLRSVHPH
ncbi:SAM-dependent methyltransferase [Thermomonospora umbrina]|uniref:S-adenosyl methyltransferase n=1 Tax=Thermomonospora umbrina TaxID=111806 RepID=A0A3D9SXJ0_9ACTN|nr:SAM-dependent methyltransferase [Thermomonospora umbrina]REE97725.1 S-adenosyl methyltransferase [Thermomonospora umbrina]